MRTSLPVALVAFLALAACAPKAGDKSAVAAVVAGQRVTVADLEGEMRVQGVANPQDPAVRRAAMERLIQRKLLAHTAAQAGITRSPDALRIRAISREELDATLARSAITGAVPKPTDAEAGAFVAAHPELFAARTLYLVDRIETAPNPDPAAITALEPTKTLEEVEKVLTDHKVAFRRAPVAVDGLQAAPFALVLSKLPPGEVFVVPEGRAFSINRIKASEVHPITGAPALEIARGLLLRSRQAQAVNAQLKALSSAVTLGPEFAPPAQASK